MGFCDNYGTGVVCSDFLTPTTSDPDPAADEYLQCLICQAADGDTILLDPSREYRLDGLPQPNWTDEDRLIRIDKSLTIDFQGAVIRFKFVPKPNEPLNRDSARWKKGFAVTAQGDCTLSYLPNKTFAR